MAKNRKVIETMRAALYARVSTIDQQSIPAQLDLARDYCKQRDWRIIGEFPEKESGKKNDRQERAKIMKLAASGKIDVVVVWKLDRWGRSSDDLLITLRELTNRGVAFVSLSEYIDLSTPIGKMIATILAAFAEFTRETIVANVKMGIAAYRAKHGKWGPAPRARAKRDEILQLKREGVSAIEIAERLRIGRATVYRLLKD